MSTPATIQFNGLTFFQSSDGYPDDVIPEMEQYVKEAKEMAERNPDFSFIRALEYLLKENYIYDEINGFPAEYSYYITKDGEVKQDED